MLSVFTLLVGDPQSGQEPPTITVTGFGEVRLPPDLAVLRFGVATRASSAAAAAGESSRRVRAITDTLRAWGLAPELVEPVALEVRTNEDPSAGRLVDYEARTTIGVRLRQLERLGPLVDLALAQGATSVPSVRFESDTVVAAERAALTQAFRDAEASAQAVTAAAGRALGALIELRVEPDYRQEFEDYDLPDYGGPRRVVKREVLVTARLTARWAIGPTR
ncbi:MAG: SIMPL domain-containing protein [Gemmatimonadetes bacterium]|nr:SIMPL domain-containing protein [Gemmatimonadota bacterium]